MSINSRTGGGVWLALTALLVPCRGQVPDRPQVFINARVITMNDSAPEAEAFAVANGRILAVGSGQEILARFSGAQETDLQGKTVMPAIIESHGHLLDLGEASLQLNLVDAGTPEAVVRKVAERVGVTAPGEWIIGWGWDEGAWASNYPTNEKLSAASPRNPVWLRGLHGFAGWANARALEVAGISRDTPDPANGKILRDSRTGRPSGILTNQAQSLLTRHIPALSRAQTERALLVAQEECLKNGLTTVHDAKVSRATLEALRALAAKKELKIRVYCMLDVTDKELVAPFLDRGPEIDPEYQLTVRSIKIFADGALGSRGAAFFEPYSDQPSTSGLMTTTREVIAELTSKALKAGLQVVTHAIGDRAIHDTLDAYAIALKEMPSPKDPRLRIEHAQIVAAQDVPRFVELGIISSMQPPHCTSDMGWAEDRVGRSRIAGAYAWRLFLDAGVHLALNSDFPGETLNPFYGMYAAETRQTPAGKPEGGWHPEQRLARREVLRAYTVEAAYSGFEEGVLGQIAPGKFADFITLSDDINQISSKSLLSLKVEKTYAGGKLRYDSGNR
jgi:predicted amidohydrolase YtcJ